MGKKVFEEILDAINQGKYEEDEIYLKDCEINDNDLMALLFAIRRTTTLDLSYGFYFNPGSLSSHKALLSLSPLLGLRSLDLSNNQIKTFIAFGIPNLLYLSLSNNKLIKFYIGEAVNLIHLDLSHNQLISFNGVNLETLVSLYLNNNQLKEFKGDMLCSLKHLDLSYNQLTKLDKESTPPNLASLHLEKNKLESFKRNGLAKLKKLYLSDIQVTIFNRKEFANLKLLSIHNNELTILKTDFMFAGLKGNTLIPFKGDGLINIKKHFLSMEGPRVANFSSDSKFVNLGNNKITTMFNREEFFKLKNTKTPLTRSKLEVSLDYHLAKRYRELSNSYVRPTNVKLIKLNKESVAGLMKEYIEAQYHNVNDMLNASITENKMMYIHLFKNLLLLNEISNPFFDKTRLDPYVFVHLILISIRIDLFHCLELLDEDLRETINWVKPKLHIHLIENLPSFFDFNKYFELIEAKMEYIRYKLNEMKEGVESNDGSAFTREYNRLKEINKGKKDDSCNKTKKDAWKANYKRKINKN